MTATATVTDTDPVVVFKRIFEAPRALVWQACTDPNHVAKWWGPHGMTNLLCEMDVRPGGVWRIDQRAPDGAVYSFTGEYLEVLKPKRIVNTQAIAGYPPLHVTVGFEDQGDATAMTEIVRFPTTADRDAALAAGMEQCAGQSIDQLAALVKAMKETMMTGTTRQTPAANHELSLTRLIDAPRDLVFKAWTDHLPEWWGPHGMTTPVCEMDLRPGGLFRTVMRAPDGTEYPHQGVFLEVLSPDRIVFTDAFLPGWIPSAKPFMTAIITLEDEGGKTRYTARALHWSDQDRQAHERMGFHQGWGESADRFEAVVARLKAGRQ